MAATRIIKKYPNRRLYDTEISSYITIEDVRQLILDGETFEVRDAKSGEDLTRSVLLQIIADIPTGRLGKPEEIAYAVAFLVAEEAEWITGSNLDINGGHHMGW